MNRRMEALVLEPASLIILGSGSAGNSAVLHGHAGWFLIDIGLNIADLRRRIAIVGLEPLRCVGCMLTHTHSDHWKDSSLAWLYGRKLPIWLHPVHLKNLRLQSKAIHTLEAAGLVHTFEADCPFEPLPGWTALPLKISHDSEPTFGFRLDVCPGFFQAAGKIGFFSDLGCWDEKHSPQLHDLQILALEFNHDQDLLQGGSRPHFLKDRICSDRGHLSNSQAGEVVSSSGIYSGRRDLVLLHLSRECNTPMHAICEAREATRKAGGEWSITVAQQDEPLQPIHAGFLNSIDQIFQAKEEAIPCPVIRRAKQ